MPAIRLGVIDSGIPAEFAVAGGVSRSFCSGTTDSSAATDRLGHGEAIARILQCGCPGSILCVAQVFDGERVVSPDRVVAALDWLTGEGVDLIHMSLGTTVPHRGLRQACERAAAAGIVLVASAPARGRLSYPAAYRKCIAVTGDARCSGDEISWLGGPSADFGAPAYGADGRFEVGGASFAAARVSAALGRLLGEGVARAEVAYVLASRCRFRGSERRVG